MQVVPERKMIIVLEQNYIRNGVCYYNYATVPIIRMNISVPELLVYARWRVINLTVPLFRD
ncbi:hypothetical protein DYBT9623_03226 [Dyadobacter sp. CECT 9623]|uniref:Uncharacterized protein n=1 Tax=Dyadobacter linearis TaxID=2823330 RepID=A0ABN7R8Z9_9BACT|nr:hypothetical protein DYBT9623_03226 [Dyadobacter sp. CECT 9623]